jgi:hypothetical protein
MEAEQIFQIPLQNLMDDDIISWQDTNDGIYMVKSGYNAQMDWDSSNPPQGHTLVLLTKRPKFGKTFGKLRFLQNKPISFGIFFITLSPSNLTSSRKESLVILYALNATMILKPSTMHSYIVNGLVNSGSLLPSPSLLPIVKLTL